MVSLSLITLYPVIMCNALQNNSNNNITYWDTYEFITDEFVTGQPMSSENIVLLLVFGILLFIAFYYIYKYIKNTIIQQRKLNENNHDRKNEKNSLKMRYIGNNNDYKNKDINAEIKFDDDDFKHV